MRIRDILSPANLVAWYKSGTAIHLLGPPGSAKSSAVRLMPELLSEALGEEFGYDEDLVPSLDAPDVRGFLIPTKDEDGNPRSVYARPDGLPSESYLHKHPFGVKLWDEFEQGDQLTKKALAPTLLEGRMGRFQFPPGWLQIACSNRMDDKAGVGRPLMHIVNRVRIVNIDLDVLGWADHWAVENGIHPLVIAFAKAKPGTFADRVPAEPKPFCSFRSMTSASNYISEVAGTDEDGAVNMNIPVSSVVQESVAGDIGEGAAAELFAFFQVVNVIPTYKEIISNPEKAKVPNESRLDAMYAAAQLCVHHAEASNVDKLWTYVERLAKELQTSTAKALLQKSGGVLLNSKALGAWVAKNRSLIMSSTS